MSNWTHVAGIIRIDDILEHDIDWDKIIGKEVHFGDGFEKWTEAEKNPNQFLPFGSEDSLYKKVWTNPNESQAARYTVSIFGDLRDHDDPDAIIKWFNNKCKWLQNNNSRLSVRQASIVVSNEKNGNREWHISIV